MIKINWAKTTGKSAENLACAFLQKQGLRLVSRNYYCRMGEIDLVMQDKEHLVFVEVRYRNDLRFGSSIESVTRHKQTKLCRTGLYYLQQHQLLEKICYRFDIVGITSQSGKPQVEWVKNAFS